MALGDSISAGFAMQGFPPRDFEEWRGYVFSVGGEDNAYTVSDFLAFYNPSIQGRAEGNTWPLTKGAWLDGGVSHASVQNVPDQITYLVNQLQTTYASTVNFQDDWKLLTLFIGANNLCGACEGRAESKPAYFQAQLQQVLTQIEQQIPRVFVNLVTIFNISGVWDAGQTSWYCEALWEGITNHECYCLTTGNKADRDLMDNYGWQYNAISQQLAAQFQAQNNPNFTVVVQPGLSGIQVGVMGEDYLSALDCFHPNLAANEAFTYQIWNNMMTPQGQKSTSPDLNNLKIICPSDQSYIQ
jgi:small subunit ribosomal protein S29e/phospholipase B1